MQKQGYSYLDISSKCYALTYKCNDGVISMDLCDGLNYYKGQINSKEMPANLSFSDSEYLNHLLHSLDPYNSDQYALSTDESGENLIFQIHLQLAGMSVKLSSIICYLYSRSSLDYLKSLINQCNSLESELDETKNKYDEISNTYRETKALLNDSIKKKIESEKILMIKYMKLLNEKKDSVIRINKVSDEDNQYESLSEESDTNVDPEPIPSVITSSSQELLSLLNTNTHVQKRTRKYMPPPPHPPQQQQQQQYKNRAIEQSPPKKRTRIRKNMNKEKQKQIEIEKQNEYENESDLLSQLDKKDSESNNQSLISQNISQCPTQIIGADNDDENKPLSDKTTQSMEGMSLSSLPTQIISISQNKPPSNDDSSINATQDKKKSSDISQIPEDLFSLL